MIRAGEFCIERQVARAVCAAMQRDDSIGPATRNVFVDCLANARFELGQIARQIDHDVALFSVHRVELNAKLRACVIRLGAAISSHALHMWTQTFIAEKRSRFNAQRSIQSRKSEANTAPLKSSPASIMHACESLAAGARRKRDLRDHLHSNQWPTTQDPAVESPRRRVVRRGADDCYWGGGAGARVSRGQLRHARAPPGHDAHLGLSLSRAFFRMGGGTRSEFLANATAALALRHTHFGNSLRPAGERHDLFDAHAACGGGYPAREITAAAVSHRARDERKHWQ